MRKTLCIIVLLAASNGWAMDVPDADSAAAKLFASRCSVCHALPHPKRLDWPHWQQMLRTMHQRMTEKGMAMLDGEWRQIATYLKQHAR